VATLGGATLDVEGGGDGWDAIDKGVAEGDAPDVDSSGAGGTTTEGADVVVVAAEGVKDSGAAEAGGTKLASRPSDEV
jgi:hypothetical protein